MIDVLLIDPDETNRVLAVRALRGAELAVSAAASIDEAHAILEAEATSILVIDEAAGAGLLDDVRVARRAFPRVPVVVTGTWLTAAVVIELLRLGIVDVLPKPYLPEGLRAAVSRALARTAPARESALDYDAAIALAHVHLEVGDARGAAAAITRAFSASPLDAETMALAALAAEIAGDDHDAGRAYRATIALANGDETVVDPRAGLARLEAYGDARPVALADASGDATAWIIGDARDLVSPPPGAEDARVIVLSLGLARGAEALWRRGEHRLFCVLPGPLTTSTVLAALRASGATGLVAAGVPGLDVLAIATLLRGAPVHAEGTSP